MTPVERFNIRVYALIFEGTKILLADEIIRGDRYTKFPGGGLEKGEGLLDGLQREAHEELGQGLVEVQHFYTTDFFQVSQFNPTDQIVSVYYKAKLSGGAKFRIAEKKFDFQEGKIESFRWMELDVIKEEELDFPIDRKVLGMIKNGES
jgi:8-oxo-dGTP diphosphatase